MPDTPVALVTGASSGIGQATAKLLAARGLHVFGTCHIPEHCHANGSFDIVHLDVTQEASVAVCVRAVLDQVGRLDVLVNNAGYGIIGPLEETTPAEAEALFAVNFFGLHRMCRAVLPALREQGGGLIVNVSSAAAFLGVPYEGLYCASKFAVEGYTEALRVEVRPFGVRVALVEPGLIRTGFRDNAHWTPPRLAAYEGHRARCAAVFGNGWDRAAPPESVARVIARIVRQRRLRLRNPVGRDAALLSGLSRWLPPAWIEYALRRYFLPPTPRS